METTTLKLFCEAIRQSLEVQKDSLLAEMRSYPQPVSGCDEQFKYLIAQRDNLYRELNLLEAITQSDKTFVAIALLVEKLLQSSTFIDAASLKHIQMELDALLV